MDRSRIISEPVPISGVLSVHESNCLTSTGIAQTEVRSHSSKTEWETLRHSKEYLDGIPYVPFDDDFFAKGNEETFNERGIREQQELLAELVEITTDAGWSAYVILYTLSTLVIVTLVGIL